MGRAKVLSSEPNALSIVETSCNFKFVIPMEKDTIGEYIKTEKKDGQITIYFTKKLNKVAFDIKDGMTVKFD
jgi:hypothetical protein